MDSVELEADLDLMFAPQASYLLGSRPSQRWRDTVGDTAAVRLRERAVPRSSSPPAPPPRPPPLPRSTDTETPPEFPVPPPTPDPFSPQRHKAVGDMSIVVFQGGFLSIHSIRVLVGQLTSHWKAANIFTGEIYVPVPLPPPTLPALNQQCVPRTFNLCVLLLSFTSSKTSVLREALPKAWSPVSFRCNLDESEPRFPLVHHFKSKEEAAEQLTFNKTWRLMMMFKGFMTDLRNSLLTADTKEEDQSLLVQHVQHLHWAFTTMIKPED